MIRTLVFTVSIAMVFASMSVAQTPATPTDELVIVKASDPQEETRISKFFKETNDKIKKEGNKQIHTYKVEANLNVLDFQYFRLKAKTAIRELNADEMRRDVDKAYLSEWTEKGKKKTWSKLSIRTEVAVPFGLDLPNLLGPIGVNFFVEGGAAAIYSLIVPTELAHKTGPGEDDERVLRTFRDKIGETYYSLKSIRLPLTAQKIIQKYPKGSEIHIEGKHHLLTSIGVQAGLPVGPSMASKLYAITEGMMRHEVKILQSDRLSLLRLRTTKMKRTANEQNLSARFSIGIFENLVSIASLSADARAVLGFNLISASRVSSNEDDFIFDYTYDLSYPAAVTAFNQAVKGNLLPTQELATFRNAGTVYLGVIVNEQNSIIIQKAIRELNIGLMAKDSYLKTELTKLKLNESMGSFLKFTRVNETRVEERNREGMYQERERYVIDESVRKRRLILFAKLLGDSSKELRIAVEKLTEDIVSEGEETRSTDLIRLSYNYEQRYKHRDRVFGDFTRTAMNTIGANVPLARTQIQEIAGSDRCSQNIRVAHQGVFYSPSIRRLLSYDDSEIWAMIGRSLGEEIPAKFRYEKMRTELITRYQQDDSTLSDSERERRDRVIKTIHQLEKTRFFDLYHKARQKETEADQAQVIAQLLKEYAFNPWMFELITLLAAYDMKDNAQMGGMLVASSIRAKGGCQFNWTYQQPMDYSLDDFFRDTVFLKKDYKE